MNKIGWQGCIFQIVEELQNIIFLKQFAQLFIESNNLNFENNFLKWKSYLYNMYIVIQIMKSILSLYDNFYILQPIKSCSAKLYIKGPAM